MTAGLERAISRHFRPSTWLVILTGIGMLWLMVQKHGNIDDDPGMYLCFLGGMILLPADSKTLFWVGLRMSLRGLPPHRAALATLGRVMLAPWIAIFLGFFIAQGTQISDKEARAFVVLWIVGCLGLDYILTASAKKELGQGIRKLAAKATFGPSSARRIIR